MSWQEKEKRTACLSDPPYVNRFPSSENVSNFLVGLNGFEPTTSPLSGVRSNHLSYRPMYPARMIITPALRIGKENPAEKPVETRTSHLSVGTKEEHFVPCHGILQNARNRHFFGAPAAGPLRIRTKENRIVMRLLLYMVELRRLELLTPCLQSRCSPS
jgi:hypothetical protein